MTSVMQDFRYALRRLRKSPAFAVTAIAMLALGIGANTAIFQLLDAVRLRLLPVENPEQLLEVKIVGGNHGIGLNQDFGELTRPLFEEIRKQQHSFRDLFAWSVNERYIGRGSDMRRFNAMWVSGNFFQALAVRPWRGRLLAAQDEGSCPVTRAVASYSYWLRELGGRDIGSGIKLVADNDLIEIVGVTPPEFFGMVVGLNFDLAFPFCQPKEALRRDVFDISVMGRLKTGWTSARASAELGALSPGLFEQTVPPGRDSSTTEAYKHFRLAAYPASTGVSSLREYNRSLTLLLVITALVLLIACVNLASLMLSRTSTRATEIAVRLALGASRTRLLRQLLAESVLLAVAGSVLGIILARFLSHLLVRAISTEDAQVTLQIVSDWRVLLFTATIATLTCMVFGVVPVVHHTRSEPLPAIKSGARGTTANRVRISLQQGLVVAQMSVSLVLLIGALLFIRSFHNLLTVNPGMRESGITTMFLGFWQSHLPPERWASFEQELLDEIRAVPGVLNAAGTTKLPLLPGAWTHTIRVGGTEGDSRFTWVSPQYFPTIGIPIRNGRGFSQQDTGTSPRVAVVNETFVRHFLGGASPIGQVLRTSPEPNYPATSYEIVGVIPDTRYNGLRGETPPITFAPLSQFPGQGPWAQRVIHSNLAASTLGGAIKRLLAQKHPDVIVEFSDLEQRVRDGLLRERLLAMLSGFFGVLATLLSVIGLYGVISYLVLTRRNEIGIRIALGASRANVVAIVLQRTGVMLAIGTVIGLILAFVGSRSVNSLLFGLRPNDPITFVAAAAGLCLAGLLAVWVPAQRASKLDPLLALRYE